MNISQYKHRPARKWKKIAFFLGLGFVYYGVTQLTAFYIPCWFYLVTGWVCPGCGVTHFCIDLIQGNIGNAVRQNLALAMLLPVWFLVGSIRLCFSPDWLTNTGKGSRILIWGSIIILIVFGILRNLPGFTFLLPLYMQ